MRTTFGWKLRSQSCLRLLCASCVFWGVPATSIANDSANRGVLSDKRVQVVIGSLVAIGCIVGMIAGRDNRGLRTPRLRLLNDPKRAQLSVLVPPGAPPRLIPSESPKAIRPRPTRGPIPRQTPDGKAGSGIVHYIAAFGEAREKERVDYLLISDETVNESLDSPEALEEENANPTRSSDP